MTSSDRHSASEAPRDDDDQVGDEWLYAVKTKSFLKMVLQKTISELTWKQMTKSSYNRDVNAKRPASTDKFNTRRVQFSDDREVPLGT